MNGNIFFELFLHDLDEKMASAGYKRERKTEHDGTTEPFGAKMKIKLSSG